MERKENKNTYRKLVIDEIDKWAYGIKHKDFSSITQLYKYNKNFFLKYLVYYIRYLRYFLGVSPFGYDLRGYSEKTKAKAKEKVYRFLHLVENREKLANLLNKANILFKEKDFECALKYYKECHEGSDLYKSITYLGSNIPMDSALKYELDEYTNIRTDYDPPFHIHRLITERRINKYYKKRWSKFFSYLYHFEFHEKKKTLKNFKYFLKERISEIEPELEAIDYYKRNIGYLNSSLKQKNFNQAFNYYIKALNYKDKIKNKDHFLDKEKEKEIERAVKNIILNLSNLIKMTVLDLGTKFTRLEIREIREKCKVDHEDLIIKIIKEMIKNNEIYAEYFKSSNSISFNQQANIDEIDDLMKKFEEWDKIDTTKKGKLEEFESNNVVRLESQSLKFKTEELQAKNNLKKEAKKTARREAEERAKKIVPFKGVQIPQSKADILQEIEKITNNQFTLVNKIESSTKMGFSVENNKVVGISLYECGISTLPESIGKLESLQGLYLGSNQLTTLPESIGNLSSLKRLSLSVNLLSTLPESIGNLSSLKDLILHNNQFTTLPESIGNLNSLKHLHATSNKLTTLPESIGNLSSLEELYLEGDKLTTLPESIGNLLSLRKLYLGSNKLTTLPESFGNLKSLQILSLSFNNLSTLPKSIGNLKSLKYLNLANNPLARKPDSRTKSILKQLKKNNIELHLIDY